MPNSSSGISLILNIRRHLFAGSVSKSFAMVYACTRCRSLIYPIPMTETSVNKYSTALTFKTVYCSSLLVYKKQLFRITNFENIALLTLCHILTWTIWAKNEAKRTILMHISTCIVYTFNWPLVYIWSYGTSDWGSHWRRSGAWTPCPTSAPGLQSPSPRGIKSDSPEPNNTSLPPFC